MTGLILASRLWNVQKIAAHMQIVADSVQGVDKLFSACYTPIINSKRLQKRTAPTREAAGTRIADTGFRKRKKYFY